MKNFASTLFLLNSSRFVLSAKSKLFFLPLILLLSSIAFAGEVLQVKGSKALLNIGDLAVSQGSEVYALNPEGKKKGLLVIRQVRNDKAVAELTKGTAEPGWSLMVKGGSAPAPAPSESDSSGEEPNTERVQDVQGSAQQQQDRAQRPKGFLGKFLKRGTAAGVMVGMAQNSMALTSKQSGVAGVSEDISLKGNSYNLTGFYDYDFSKSITVRGVVGMETFDVSGTSSKPVCSNGTSCSASFTYLAGEAHGHYNFMRGKTRGWVGAGFLFLLTMAKSSTITSLDASNSTNQMITFEGGADIDMGKGHFIPVSLEYGLYPGSSSVKAQSLFLRAGYGWRF